MQDGHYSITAEHRLFNYLEMTPIAFKIAYPANAKESSSTEGIHNFCRYPKA